MCPQPTVVSRLSENSLYKKTIRNLKNFKMCYRKIENYKRNGKDHDLGTEENTFPST